MIPEGEGERSHGAGGCGAKRDVERGGGADLEPIPQGERESLGLFGEVFVEQLPPPSFGQKARRLGASLVGDAGNHRGSSHFEGTIYNLQELPPGVAMMQQTAADRDG